MCHSDELNPNVWEQFLVEYKSLGILGCELGPSGIENMAFRY